MGQNTNPAPINLSLPHKKEQDVTKEPDDDIVYSTARTGEYEDTRKCGAVGN